MLTAWTGAVLFLTIAVVYTLLALGLPLGEYAMGGRHVVLPNNLRAVAAVGVIIQLFAVLVLLQLGGIFSIGLPPGLARGLGFFFGGFLLLNTLGNAASRSRKERLVMTPLSAVAAFCFLYTAWAA